MNLLIKVILTFMSGLCLLFLIFFTFIAPSYIQNINKNFEINPTQLSIIEKTDNTYSITTQINKGSLSKNAFYKQNIGLANAVYYKKGNIKIETDTEKNKIELSTGLYFIEINEIGLDSEFYIGGFKIANLGPGNFIINQTEKYISFFPLSTKLKIEAYNNTYTQLYNTLELFPNTYFVIEKGLNHRLNKADLSKIQLSSTTFNIKRRELGSIADSLYTYNDVSKPILNKDIQKYVFLGDKNNYNFIYDIYQKIKYSQEKTHQKYQDLTNDDFYYFPGTRYIREYYGYFINDEKKIYYYKNLITQDIIELLKQDNIVKDFEYIEKKVEILNELDIQEAENIKNYIKYYYHNTLNSQRSNQVTLNNITLLYYSIFNINTKISQNSLLLLRNIYDDINTGKNIKFANRLSEFVGAYENEMTISIYDNFNIIHAYFLFYLKNILISQNLDQFDVNSLVSLFEKYSSVNQQYFNASNQITKKTVLFENAIILQNYTKLLYNSLFQEERGNNGLLVPKNIKTLNSKSYQKIKVELNRLIDTFVKYKYVIQGGSDSLKEEELEKIYSQTDILLKEYFSATEDYNQYELDYDLANKNTPVFTSENDEILISIENAKKYLSQFSGITMSQAKIYLRPHIYCETGDEAYIDESGISCYEVENLEINGHIFSFILDPKKGNKITKMQYVDLEGNVIKVNSSIVLDRIEQQWEKLSESSQDDFDKYNFSKFFSNTYTKTQKIDDKNNIADNSSEELFTLPDNLPEETVGIKKLKRNLLSSEAPLYKIRATLKVPYEHLLVTRKQDGYDIEIFPSTLHVRSSINEKPTNFQGLLEAKYNYTPDKNSLDGIRIFIQSPSIRHRKEFLFNSLPITLEKEIKIEDLKELLEIMFSKATTFNSIFQSVKDKFPESVFQLYYENENAQYIIKIDNGYTFEYNSNGRINVLKDGTPLGTSSSIGIRGYLNTLP